MTERAEDLPSDVSVAVASVVDTYRGAAFEADIFSVVAVAVAACQWVDVLFCLRGVVLLLVLWLL